jgi:hypothetical protein
MERGPENLFLKAYPSHANKIGHDIIPTDTELKPDTQPSSASVCVGPTFGSWQMILMS